MGQKGQKGQKGQLSIFLGISVLIIVTLIAFVINVGLFVKAKINLQNAVDAAAWAGAATQARQLTHMAYLNWEMRNTYKEWMFKYYVLGQLSLDNIKTPPTSGGAGGRPSMSFRGRKIGALASISDDKEDFYNIPSICVDFRDERTLCKFYSIPGLPRFQSPGLPGVDQAHNEFLDSIVASKATACAQRSDINFSVGMSWAYGVRDRPPLPGTPAIGTDRVGAWPESLELALRMRNLEMIANQPPHQDICYQGDCNTVVTELSEQGREIGLNQRTVNAFWSAFRNLSGGAGKEQGNDEFAWSFRLSELAPVPPNLEDGENMSNYLIPANHQARQKYYLDLQTYPLNLVTFFSSFTATDTNTGSSGGVRGEASCSVSKIAIPVPAYILGFVKNPKVMTYYAVKGEAKFVGMFFPFRSLEGITLRAYAAAKPFGGKIGPHLFKIAGGSSIRPRLHRSTAYIGAPNEVSLGGVGYQAGNPLPSAPGFWAQDGGDNVGGNPEALGDQARYAIPNLLYDFLGAMDDQTRSGASDNTLLIIDKDSRGGGATFQLAEKIGLYDGEQFEAFASNLRVGNTVFPNFLNSPTSTSTTGIDPINLQQSFERVRAPTKYEGLNYLVPTHYPLDDGKNDSVPFVSETPVDGAYHYRIFAPLYGGNTLWENAAAATGQLDDYIRNSGTAIGAFITALDEAAQSIRTSSSGNLYREAANFIHPDGNPDVSNCGDDQSLAVKFQRFFSHAGADTLCGITKLPALIREYWADTNKVDPLYYRASYRPRDDNYDNLEYSTAYSPGRRQGGTEAGVVEHPFLGGRPPLSSRRNYYSTKFVEMSKLVQGGGGGGRSYFDFPLYRENDNLGARGFLDGQLNTPSDGNRLLASELPLSEFPPPLTH